MKVMKLVKKKSEIDYDELKNEYCEFNQIAFYI